MFWNVAHWERSLWMSGFIGGFEILSSFQGAAALDVQSERAGKRGSLWWGEAAVGATLSLAIPSGPISSTTGATKACWVAIRQSLLHRHHKRLLYSINGFQIKMILITGFLPPPNHIDVAPCRENTARPPPEAPPCAPPCAPPITPSSPGPSAHGWNQEVVCIQPSRSTTPPENTEHPPLDTRHVGGSFFLFML